MSNNLILIGLLLGLDSLAVGTGLGAAVPERNRRLWLALSFGLCDGLATLIGLIIDMDRVRSSLEWCEWLGPAAVAGYGLYVLYLAWHCQNLAANPGAARWLAFGLPLCLSLDNLVTAGAGTAASGVPAVLLALTFGLISGGMASLGMWAGAALGTRVRLGAGWIGGAVLILVAVGLVLKESVS